MTDIPQWNSPTARMINGTDAVVFHTNISRSDVLTAFTDDFKRYVLLTLHILIITIILRSAYFSYQNDEYIYDLLSYRFVFPDEALNTSNIDPGFYPNGPNGLYNISAIEPLSKD